MSFIIKPKEIKGDVTWKGVNLGLNPDITEQVGELLRKDTTGIIQPLHTTERQTNIEETGYYKGFVTIIMKDAENKYKGYASKDIEINGVKKTIDVETEIRDTFNECGKDLNERINLIRDRYLKFVIVDGVVN